ncbi:hypothetical protein BH18GEM1_BH18GEM1_03170 [soil metagenome]
MSTRRASEKRATLIKLRACATAATGVLLWIYPPGDGVSTPLAATWLLYVLSTITGALIPVRLYQHPRFEVAFVGIEIALLSTFLTTYGGWDLSLFYPLFLLTVLLAALSRRLAWALGLGVAGAVAQFLLFQGMIDPGVMILQGALLLATAALVGFLTEALDREESSSALLRNALEVSTLLASEQEEEAVYRRLSDIVARLFHAGRVAVILADRETGKARVAAAVDRGEPVHNLSIDLEKYPEIQTALRTLQQVVIDRAEDHPRMAEVRSQLPDRALSASILVTPVHHDEMARGVVFVRLEGNQRAFTENELQFCQLMASVAARALQRADDFAVVSEAARRDGLTGLFNVREFQRILRDEIARSERVGVGCTLLMMDVDFLKQVNDTYGHPAGDRVLKSLAASLLRHVREIDTVARYGGEEFAILLPETGGDRALVTAERLRDEIERIHHEGIAETVTVSIGIASYPEDAVTANDALYKADQALYFSKNRGRNRVARFGPVHLLERAGAENDMPNTALRARHDSSMVRAMRESLGSLATHGQTLRNMDIIATLATIMRARDPRALNELREVSSLAELFLAHFPVADHQRWAIHVATLLRDIGKLAIADDILSKHDFLTREEYEVVRQHPVIGAQIIEPLKGFDTIVPLIRHHHERWAGRGYPDGLRGESIPMGARVVGLIDAFHAMVRRQPRSGRPGDLDYACNEIRGNAGSQFDPQLAERFLFVVETNCDLIATLGPGVLPYGTVAKTATSGTP